MPRKRALFLLVVCVATVVSGAERLYPVYPRNGDITLDGRLDETAWQGAPAASDFFFYKRPQPVQRTEFRVLHDSEALYVGITASESAVHALVVEQGDGEIVWQDDSIELFLQADRAKKHYRVGVNAAGKRSDAAVTAAGRQTPDAYVLEFRVPFSVLGETPADGAVIWGNVCRNTRTRGPVRHSSWSRVETSFHEPHHFGELWLRPTGITTAQVAAVTAFVDLAYASSVLDGARREGAAYATLLERADRFDAPDADAEALVAGWRERHAAADRYLAYFAHFNASRHDAGFWEQDHGVVLQRGACRQAVAYLNPAPLSEAERELDYHYRLLELLE